MGRYCTPPVSRRAYVTSLVDSSDHVLGVRVLVKSLRNSGAKSQDVIVIVTEEYFQSHEHELSILDGEQIDVQVVSALSGVQPSTRVLLHLWKLSNYDRVIYFDSRTMIEKNPDTLFACQGFCARLGDKESSEDLSTGVLVLEPSALAYDQMLALAAAQQEGPSEIFSTYFTISSCPMFDQLVTVFDGDLGSAKEFHQSPLGLSNSETIPVCSSSQKSDLSTCKILPYTYSATSTDFHVQGKWKDKDCTHWLCAEIPQPHVIRFAREEQPWNSLEYPNKPLFWKWDRYRKQLDKPYGNLMSPWAMFWMPCCVMLASISFLRCKPLSFKPSSISSEANDSGAEPSSWNGELRYRLERHFSSSVFDEEEEDDEEDDEEDLSTPSSPDAAAGPTAKPKNPGDTREDRFSAFTRIEMQASQTESVEEGEEQFQFPRNNSTPQLIQPQVARLTTVEELRFALEGKLRRKPSSSSQVSSHPSEASLDNSRPHTSVADALDKLPTLEGARSILGGDRRTHHRTRSTSGKSNAGPESSSNGALSLPRHIAYAAGVFVGIIGYLWYRTIYRVSLDMVEPEWHPSSAILVYQAWLGCGLLCGMLLIDYGYHFFCTRALYFLKDLSVASPFYATVILLITRWNLAVGTMVAMANLFLGIFYRNGGFQHSLARNWHYWLLLLSCVACMGSVLAVCFWDEPREHVKRATVAMCIRTHTVYTVALYCSVVCGPHLYADLISEAHHVRQGVVAAMLWVQRRVSWRVMLLVPFIMGIHSLQLVLHGQNSIRLPHHCLYHRAPTNQGYLNPLEHMLSKTCGKHTFLKLEATTEYFEGFRQYKFCLKTSGGKYLSLHRTLQDSCTPDNQFVLQPKGRAYCLYSSISALYLSSTRYPQAYCTETELWELNGFFDSRDVWGFLPQVKAVFRSDFCSEMPVVAFSFYFLSVFIMWMRRNSRKQLWYTLLSSLVWSLLPIHVLYSLLNDFNMTQTDVSPTKPMVLPGMEEYLPPVQPDESRHCEFLWEVMKSLLSKYYVILVALVSLHAHLSSKSHTGFGFLGLRDFDPMELWKMRLTGILTTFLAGLVARFHQGSWLGTWQQKCLMPEEDNSEWMMCSSFQCLIFGFSVGTFYVRRPNAARPLFTFGLGLILLSSVILFSLAFDIIYVSLWVILILWSSWNVSSMYVNVVLGEQQLLRQIIEGLKWMSRCDSFAHLASKIVEANKRVLLKKDSELYAEEDETALYSPTTIEPSHLEHHVTGNSHTPP